MPHRSAEVTLADLERGQTQTAIVELELGNRPGGTYRVARIEAVYDDCVTGRPESVSGDVVLQFTNDEALVAGGVNEQVLREVEVAEASRNLEKTVMGMRTQQVSPAEAISELQKTQSLLISQGKTLQAQDIQNAIDQIKQGAGAEKTLMGTIIDLDRGKS